MARIAATLGLVVLLASCASEGDHQHPLSDGWHYATIFRVGGEFEPTHPSRFDCRLEDGESWARYAEVAYRANHALRHRIVRLPAEGPEFHVGDKVYVNVLDCSVPVARPRL